MPSHTVVTSYLSAIAARAALAERAPELDRARGRMEPFLMSQNQAPAAGNGTTIASLFTAYRDSGFAAAEYSLSPAFMDTRALASPGGSAIPTNFADFVTKYERTANPMLDPSIVRVMDADDGTRSCFPGSPPT